MYSAVCPRPPFLGSPVVARRPHGPLPTSTRSSITIAQTRPYYTPSSQATEIHTGHLSLLIRCIHHSPPFCTSRVWHAVPFARNLFLHFRSDDCPLKQTSAFPRSLPFLFIYSKWHIRVHCRHNANTDLNSPLSIIESASPRCRKASFITDGVINISIR